MAAALAERTPKSRERVARTSKRAPYFKIGAMEVPVMSSISLDMMRGSVHSRMTSMVTKSGVSMDTRLYWRTLFKSVLTMNDLPRFHIKFAIPQKLLMRRTCRFCRWDPSGYSGHISDHLVDDPEKHGEILRRYSGGQTIFGFFQTLVDQFLILHGFFSSDNAF